MPRGGKSVNRPPTPEPEDQTRELSLEEDIRLRVIRLAAICTWHKTAIPKRLLLLGSWCRAGLSRGQQTTCLWHACMNVLWKCLLPECTDDLQIERFACAATARSRLDRQCQRTHERWAKQCCSEHFGSTMHFVCMKFDISQLHSSIYCCRSLHSQEKTGPGATAR